MAEYLPDKFVFYFKSVDAKPGFGEGEYVESFEKYQNLGKYPNWRRVLTHFHVCKFIYMGKSYKTIEHAYQASKIAIADPNMAHLFAMESDSTLSYSDGFTAREARKMIVLTTNQLAEWHSKSYQIMTDITRAKYHQCCTARRVLKETKDAQLWHFERGIPLTQWIHLEQLRSTL